MIETPKVLVRGRDRLAAMRNAEAKLESAKRRRAAPRKPKEPAYPTPEEAQALARQAFERAYSVQLNEELKRFRMHSDSMGEALQKWCISNEAWLRKVLAGQVGVYGLDKAALGYAESHFRIQDSLRKPIQAQQAEAAQ